MSGLIISVNLPGNLSGFTKHTTVQQYSVKTRDLKTGKDTIVTSQILHTDRVPQPCVKIININPAVVKLWKSSAIPYWETQKDWKKMSIEQKIASHVARFDEGYGVQYE